MPFGEVRLLPGVNVERTATLLEAGYASASLIRFKDGLAQKYGGWEKYYSSALTGTPRDLHAWEDLNQDKHLAVGTTRQVVVITDGTLADITPQALITDFPEDFSTVSGSTLVEVQDPDVSNVTVFDSVLFNTPISVGGLILSGLYSIDVITGTHKYKITAASAATATVNNGGAVPAFTTTSGSSSVSVAFNDHGLSVGSVIVFPVATTGNGVTISGSYPAATITSVNAFTIIASSESSANGSFDMNGGEAELVYSINIGPAAAGAGYGLGNYGEGGYGTGTTPSAQTGTPITATDWTSDNWGQVLLASPSGGGVYQFDPTGGFTNAGLVSTAPAHNGGIFVSTSQQILMCWASTSVKNIGIQQDPMLVKWSASGDYSDFVALSTNQAGSFRIPIGSEIRGGMAVANQNLFWTDLDLWAANYQGPPFVYGFNKVGAGAGLISSHGAQQLRGGVYWMGPTNFYSYNANGVSVIPCPVWDFVFQNLNTGSDGNGRPYTANIRAMPNTPFNEAGWLFPSTASSNGENDCYVKFNITEPGAPWDFGPAAALPRSAWMDQTVLGMPIAASPTGIIYSQETTNDADNAPLNATFTSGYFFIAQGEDFAFVDQILPDFKWGQYSQSQGAQVQLTVNVIDYPGDTPQTFGPYTFTSTTTYQTTRIRGRQMSFTIQSSDIGSFWRLGRVRYRWATAGRR